MLSEEREILDQLRHQWFVRGSLTDQEMHDALKEVSRGHNPFLDKELITKLKKDPNFRIDEVENYRLEADL